MIKIKYCGLMTPADVNQAIEAGVDAIGVVFVTKSPRYVEPEVAKRLISMAKEAGVLTVALFADQSSSEVIQIIDKCQPDILQFHGAESAEFCEQFNLKYWKAIPMLDMVDCLSYMDQFPTADAFLLDAYGTKQSGGSGKSFEWFKFPDACKEKMILAGGIDIENVELAISVTGAQYIDTSSGIEQARGVKSQIKMKALAKKIKHLNATVS
jgi:phosphoribosylanthranilate isomerase